ncbi:MAG: ATP-dependent DNA helicase [Planctomycetota bacterium]
MTTRAPATTSDLSLLDQLNPEQHTAATTRGPLIVLAGPGTGKTRVIIARILHLLEQGAAPDTILGLTFTIRAAEEMRERLATVTDHATAQSVKLATFHSFGSSLIRQFGDALGLPREPRLIDSAQRRKILRQIIADLAVFPEGVADRYNGAIERLTAFMHACHSSGKLPSETIAYAEQWRVLLEDKVFEQPEDEPIERDAWRVFESSARVYQRFEQTLRTEGFFTFDHFLSYPTELLETNQRVRDLTHARLRHLLVDEFQDVNSAQLRMLEALAPPSTSSSRSPDLCIVGDDDQAIYSFRGSSAQAFSHFASRWTDATTIELTRNYRSSRAILSAASTIITPCTDRFAPDKQTIAEGENADHDPAAVYSIRYNPKQPEQQHAAIAAETRRLINAGTDPGQIAVLCRIHSHLTSVADALELEGLPIERKTYPSPLDDRAVQDLLAWMRLTAAEPTLPDLQRVLRRPPNNLDDAELTTITLSARNTRRTRGDGLLEHFDAHEQASATTQRIVKLVRTFREATLDTPGDRMVERLIRDTGLAEGEPLSSHQRAVRVRALVSVIRFVRDKQSIIDAPATLAQFLEHYDLLDPKEQEFNASSIAQLDANTDDAELEGGRVALLTAHTSKGLEFDAVIVPNTSPGWGYPCTQMRRDESPLPDDFRGESSMSVIDEERRLFFVVCTRARKELILLTKDTKKRSSKNTVNFNDELATRPADAIAEHLADDRLTDAPIRDDLTAAFLPSDDPQADLAARRLAELRHRAFAAIHDAQQPGSLDHLDAIEHRITETTRDLAHTAAYMRHEDGADKLIPTDLIESIDRRQLRVTAPVPPPLRLSYSHIKRYLDCPLSYYLQYVLGLDEPKTAALIAGTVTHNTLETLTKLLMSHHADPASVPPPDDAAIERTVRNAYEQARQKNTPFDQDELDHAMHHVRTAFVDMRDDAETLEAERTVILPYELDGHIHTIVAKIDRVDRLPDGSFRIVDYKTGSPSKDKLDPSPSDLQLGIYALALAHDQGLPKGELPEGVVEYWLTRTGDRGSKNIAELNLDKTREKINKAVRGILAGDFQKGNNSSPIVDLIPAWQQ